MIIKAVRGLVAATVAVGIALVPAVEPASSGVARADDIPTNWWYDYYSVGDFHAQGLNGQGVKVAVIGGQINSALPVLEGANLTVHEPSICDDGGNAATTDLNAGSQHDSEVVALWVGNGEGPAKTEGIAPGVDLTFYGYGASNSCQETMIDGHQVSGFGAALHQAVADGNRIVQTSTGFSVVTDGDAAEVAGAIRAGVVIVASTPNTLSGSKSEALFPSRFNGVVAVGSYSQSGSLEPDEQDSSKVVAWPEVTVVAPGVDLPLAGYVSKGTWDGLSRSTGSSFAAPLVGGILALAWQKYPKATSNQLIQSLIRNTTTTDHALSRDTTGGLGYGPASLRHVLAEDPTQYPDVNPLMDKSYGKPTAAQVSGTTSTPGTATPSTSGAPVPHDGDNGLIVGLLIAGGVLVLLVVVAVVLVIVLVARRSKPGGNGGMS